MDGVIASVLAALQRDEFPSLDVLAGLGEAEPAASAEWLRRVARLPELRASRASWLPALLLSAWPGRGARALYELAGRIREQCGAPLDPARMPSLALLLGCSDFLARQLIENPHWAQDVSGDPPPPPDECSPPPASSWADIRDARYRGTLRAAARELLGCPLQETFEELSGLADRCLVRALECAAAETGDPVPGVLALGSLGAREISLTPRIELLVLAATGESARWGVAGFERLLQVLSSGLQKGGRPLYRVSAVLGPQVAGGAMGVWNDPYGFANAARLEGPIGGLAARSSLLRARWLAGPRRPAEEFLSAIRTDLLRDGAEAVAAVSGVPLRSPPASQRIASERDLRWGPGGIRQVELYVQRLVLSHGAAGGRSGSGGLLDDLARLGRLGRVDELRARALGDAYGWLRRAEHFLQLADDEPVHELPDRLDEQIALSRRMGYREVDARSARRRLLRDWRSVTEQVRIVTGCR